MPGFDPKAYLQEQAMPSGGFDPKAYLSDGSAKPDILVNEGSGQAALEHFGNAATLGYLPHLQALAEKLMPDPTKAVDADLESKGFSVKGDDRNYLQNRDANIARLKNESEQHPIASGAGSVAGVVAGGALMQPLAGARAATAAGRIAQGVKTGALMGAIANPGDKEGELNPLQIDERLSNAKSGAIVGGVVSGAIEAAPHILNGIKTAGRKVAAAVSGAAEGDIAQYAARTDEINQMIKQSGGNMTEAADQVRQDAQNAIRGKRAELSAKIGSALKSAPTDPVADISPIVDQLEKVKGRLNPNLQFEGVSQIDDMINKLKTEGSQNGGKVSIQQLNQVTDFLQSRAKSAYLSGGQIFQNAKEAAQAAKGAAAVSRKMLNGLSPEIADANNKLAFLHSLEDRLNPNLLAPGKPDAALMAAGAGNNPRNAKLLEAMSDASGYPILDKAKDLSAARTFASPGLLPSDGTGKAAARQLMAAGIGHAVAGPAGYAAAALASPAAVKLGVNTANVVSKFVPDVISAAKNSPALVQRVANAVIPKAGLPSSPDESTPLDPATLGIFKSNPKLIDSLKDGPLKDAINKHIGRSPTSPVGEDKWVQDGISKVGISDQDLAQKVMQDPKARKLLIQASDLSPNSKAMQKIKTQIKEGWGNK